MDTSFLRLPEVKRRTGLARSTIYLRIANGLLTAPISLGGRAVGYPAHEIEAINAARIAGKNNDQIRQLVADLHAKRKTVWRISDYPENVGKDANK